MATTRISPKQLKDLEKDFEEKVQQTALKFPGDVVRIRFTIKPDWSDDLSAYFRVVLSDEASRDRRAQIIRRLSEQLEDDLDLKNLDLFPYVSFRSKSEVDRLQDPGWE
jgi:hypothetical protein